MFLCIIFGLVVYRLITRAKLPWHRLVNGTMNNYVVVYICVYVICFDVLAPDVVAFFGLEWITGSAKLCSTV